MAIYHFQDTKFDIVKKTTFSEEGLLERQNIQSALKKNIEIIAPDCLVISEEFSEWSEGQRRIDLLAIDQDANIVVIELKRNETGEHMELQALRYASMVSTLTYTRAIEIYQKYLDIEKIEGDAETLLLEFLKEKDSIEDDFALETKIILVSAGFSKELTTSVLWLNEQKLKIKCIRLVPYKFEGRVLVDVQQIVPLLEAENYQVKVRQQTEERKAARQDSRDFSKYEFEGRVYNKRNFVLAIVTKWVEQNSPTCLNDLIMAFPQDIRRGGVFFKLDKAKEIFDRTNKKRHFIEESEIFIFPDGMEYALSDQWGSDNFERFVLKANALEFRFIEVT